ncbi:semaphorin-1A, partial [Caerostris extrusa]
YRYTHIAVDPQIETANGEKLMFCLLEQESKHNNSFTTRGTEKRLFGIGSDGTESINDPINRWDILPKREDFPPKGESKQKFPQKPWGIYTCVGLRDPYCAWDINQSLYQFKSKGGSTRLSSPQQESKTDTRCLLFKQVMLQDRILKSDKFVQNVVDGWDARCPEDPKPSTSPITVPSTTEMSTEQSLTCPPCPIKCVCPSVPAYMDNEVDQVGRPLNKETSPQRSPHQSASRHDNHLGGAGPLPRKTRTSDQTVIIPDAPESARDYHLIYTAETLAIAVTSSIVSSLVVGFISGYIFSRRCRNEEIESPYDEGPYLEQQHNARMDHRNLDTFLPATVNNKPINLVLNVPPKSGKTANSSADNKPIQKVKRSIYSQLTCSTMELNLSYVYRFVCMCLRFFSLERQLIFLEQEKSLLRGTITRQPSFFFLFTSCGFLFSSPAAVDIGVFVNYVTTNSLRDCLVRS